MKKGQVTVWVIIAIFLVGAIIVAVMLWSMLDVEPEVRECSHDGDCWPATCYDSNECVPKDFVSYPYENYCNNVVFTENCSKEESRTVTTGTGEDAVTVTYIDVSECDVINQCVLKCSYILGDVDCAPDLKDCSEPEVIYTPNPDLKINLHPSFNGMKGKCACDSRRHKCVVE